MSESPFIVDVTQYNFRAVVQEGSQRVPVLVDFWAAWCQPCKTLMPVLAKLAEEYQGAFVLAKIDTDREQALAAHLQIRSLPTVMLVKGGQVVEQFTGAQPESVVRALLERHVAKPEGPRELAERLVAAGRLEEARQLLLRAVAAAPEDVKLKLALARVIAAAGDVTAAQGLYDQLPADARLEPEARALKAQLRFLALVPTLPPADALQARLAQGPDSEAAYQLALHLIAAGNYAGAMDMLYGLTQRDRSYGEDLARKTLLELFDLLGADDPLVKTYRKRLFAALY